MVFTCVTNTAALIWSINSDTSDEIIYHSASQVNLPILVGIFTIKLVSTTDGLKSTATASNVALNSSGSNIACTNNIQSNHHSDAENFKTMSIIIGEASTLYTLPTKNYCYVAISIGTPPSSPLNIHITLVTVTSVSISWVAPLDTPLCIHSYTVTVRNSCNSSQEMAYNTTDNRSSLSITNLTSDGEYSVTVAGRDGAGRLGLQSEKLEFICEHNRLFQFMQYL